MDKQLRLEKYLSIEEVAAKLDVSSASVRNWVKTGYLTLDEGNRVNADSLLSFETNTIGAIKLNQRANKSRRDSHNHTDVQQTILNRVSALSSDEVSGIGSDYENALSNAYRNKEGIYYTPQFIVDDFFSQFASLTAKEMETLTFLDPCCGSGNFLLGAIQHGFAPQNVYGFDCDPVAVELSRARIHALTGIETDNIECKDFLEQSLEQADKPNFDLIFTNPPWGKRIDRAGRKKFAAVFDMDESCDTCSLFLFAAFSQLKTKGIIGFLMPSAFFNIATFSSARSQLLKKNLLSVTDYGKPFKGLMTGAAGFVARNEQVVEQTDDVVCVAIGASGQPSQQTTQQSRLGHAQQRSQQSFASNPKTIINHTVDAQAADTIAWLYAQKHTTLQNNATWALGIVTGNNKKFLSPRCKPGHVQVFKGADITHSGLKASSYFLSENFTQYQQVAPRELYAAKEKIVYKFISDNLCFYHDKSQSLFLNSANMFVLHKSFPINHEQLTWLLNTELLNWLFRSLFVTNKVLRSDLETLPIFADFFAHHRQYSEHDLLAYLKVEKSADGFLVKP